MNNRPVLLLVLCGVLAGSVFAQTRVNGYFSADYLKGQSQSLFRKGSFQNTSAGLLFYGEKTPAFSYALEIQSNAAVRFEIVQAWASFLWSDALHLKLGLYLVPFGKYNESSRAFQTSLVQPPFPLSEFYPQNWRDIGLLVEGKTGFLAYSAYVGNGLAEAENLRAGQQFKDNNRDKGRGARLGFHLSQSLEAGFSYYAGRIDEENQRNLLLRGWDITWSGRSIRLAAEYAKAEIENPAPFSKGIAEGWFILCSINVGALSPLVAYEKYTYEDAFHGERYAGPLAAGRGIFDHRSLWAVGLVYAPHENFFLKFEYDFNRESNLELRDNVFRAQAAVHF